MQLNDDNAGTRHTSLSFMRFWYFAIRGKGGTRHLPYYYWGTLCCLWWVPSPWGDEESHPSRCCLTQRGLWSVHVLLAFIQWSIGVQLSGAGHFCCQSVWFLCCVLDSKHCNLTLIKGKKTKISAPARNQHKMNSALSVQAVLLQSFSPWPPKRWGCLSFMT